MDEEELDEGQGNGKNNGSGDTLGPSTEEVQPTGPRVGVKQNTRGRF
jgi:hypothetical protein